MKHQQSHKDEYGPAPPREAIAEAGEDGTEPAAGQADNNVPLSASLRQDNQDYVRHFFGLDRYRQWLTKARRQHRADTPGLQPSSEAAGQPAPADQSGQK
ncbi:hypothetical protein [Chitinolyticbacter meiyuanensis]|uniref:hypothetical protein n=1 Tax=Chitinolyticbacter meiyuanensis TaxID=682798 RepID=UPI0011E5E2F7|nr:hypothetical protein [Chitinolyticbacter meiyuanensis]